MSEEIDCNEKLDSALVRQLIGQALDVGTVWLTDHCRKGQRERRVLMTEVLNCLRKGAIGEGCFEEGAWRYRVSDDFMTAVVEFESPIEVTVVTIWKIDN
ncbi:MAG: hypothetical protein HY292_11880 [Planctomycetes bacterium]|nr:hypothetical protein [Planctomycetota bacterium]